MFRPGEIGRQSRRAGQLQDVHACIGPIHRVDVAPVVHFDVVDLNSHLAALVGSLPCAARIGAVRNRRNVASDL
jgi:hypothetical protein